MSYRVLDEGVAWTPSVGVSGAAFKSADASTTVAVTDAPTSGEHLVITDVTVSSAAAMLMELEEETSGDVIFSLHVAQDSVHTIPIRSPIKLAVADKKLFLNTDTGGSVSVTAVYYSTTNGLP